MPPVAAALTVADRMKRTVVAARERVLKIAEARLPALTRLKRPEALPITLDRRRIYVLPTRHGLFFGGLLCAMTIGALNYNNNPALMLCFLMLSAAHTSLLRAFLAMRGLRLEQVGSEAVHAGEAQTLRLLFSGAEPRRRRGIVVRKDNAAVAFMLEPDARTEVRLPIAAPRRGWHAIGRMHLSTTHPLGLFIVWSWINPEAHALVYPALEPSAPVLPGSGERGQPRRRKGLDEEPHSLRDYRAGDPLRLMAWKRSAQIGRAMVREFESPAGRDVLLDWRELGALESEARIRRLARWVLEAERQGLRTTLLLPTGRIGPGSGAVHVQACLRELALMP
jgi:uncharacterized protein (DUF58 family)